MVYRVFMLEFQSPEGVQAFARSQMVYPSAPHAPAAAEVAPCATPSAAPEVPLAAHAPAPVAAAASRSDCGPPVLSGFRGIPTQAVVTKSSNAPSYDEFPAVVVAELPGPSPCPLASMIVELSCAIHRSEYEDGLKVLDDMQPRATTGIQDFPDATARHFDGRHFDGRTSGSGAEAQISAVNNSKHVHFLV